MIPKLRPVLLIVVALLLFSAQAAPEITANGLFPGKALLTIDGERVLISLGQTRHGVRLIEANQDHAVIEADGKKQTLYLDKSIAKEYSTPEQFKRYSKSKSHVISADIIHQTGNLATFSVEYYFAKSPANRANLIAKTLSQGSATEYWAHTYTPLEYGRHTTSITVAMNEKVPETYVSDQMLFEIFWYNNRQSGATGAYVMEFIKQWRD